MKHIINFLDEWGDYKSKDKLRRSDKSKEVQAAEIENILKDIALRFERSPNASTFAVWAKDLIKSGYEDWMIKEIAHIIPIKFDRHPTLAQLNDLLRPYLARKAIAYEDELDIVTQAAIPHLKAKFIAISGQEIFDRMVNYYAKEILGGSAYGAQMAMLADWCRSYLATDPKKIIEQGIRTNMAWARNDREYFIRPLRNYCVANKLIM